MVKGRHGKPNHKKGPNSTVASANDRSAKADLPIFQRAPPSDDVQDSIIQTDSPLLLTLLFRDKNSQHSALARIESFYESKVGDENNTLQKFITLEQAKGQKLCTNYQAFNCPIKSIQDWLNQMRLVHNIPSSDGMKMEENDTSDQDEMSAMKGNLWWEPFCNEEEKVLLKFLDDIGSLDENFEQNKSSPQYLITSLSSQANSSLPHERLHFLYFISADYRSFVETEFDSLSAKNRKIIETDLGMRGYAKHVWPDEFQAYVSLSSSEFGNPTKSECALIKSKLQEKQRYIWKQLNV